MSPIQTGRCSPDGEQSLRVLCVDDNHDVADSEVDLLVSAGFIARACYNGATALAESARFRPTVCLIDLNMPEMRGDELAALLRGRDGTSVLLVAVTAMSDEASCARIRAAGFDNHLIKPVEPRALIRLLMQREQEPHE